MTADSAQESRVNDYARRMARATEAALSKGLRGLLVTPGPDLTYLCGYVSHVSERLTMLVLTPQRQPTLIVPTLERPDAQQAAGAAAIHMSDWLDGADPFALAATLIDEPGRYAISDAAWALQVLGLQAALPQVSLTSLTDTLPMLRAAKDEHELQRMAAAAAAADAAFADVLGLRFAGRRECDIADDLARLLRHHGHQYVDFTVVGSGPHGADPHHGAGQRIIEAGDAVVLDFGGRRDEYSSDITRTVSVGPPSEELIRVYEIVREAQQAAFEAVATGVACQEIDRVARRIITDAGYGEYFIHRVGHGIGLATHEPPYLVEGETAPLIDGMCFSIEPGIYLPGRFGVRIEDIVTAGPQGGRRLNNASLELQIVS